MQEIKNYLQGEFKQDPIYRALKKAYGTCDHDHRERSKGKNSIFPPSVNVLHHYIKHLENSSEKPEDTLHHILIGMAKQMDEYYYRLMDEVLTTPKPIAVD